MRFFVLMAIYGVVAIVLETTVLAGFPTEMLRFDLMLPAVAALSFYKGRAQAIPVIIFFGLLMDVASAAPFGMTVLSYLFIYFFMRLIIAKISFQEGIGLLFWVAIISLMDKAVCIMVLTASTGKLKMAGILVERAPAQALLDAAVGLLLVPLLVRYWDLSWQKLREPKGLVLK
ncbi:MAG: rod shape-determining protein MreD [Pseudomonadota bacterium]